MGVKTAVVRVILYKRTVICRIGSLENNLQGLDNVVHVICRIGSLEMRVRYDTAGTVVICRIGSLENRGLSIEILNRVICRIGSLESADVPEPKQDEGYLPHRQLRKLLGGENEVK